MSREENLTLSLTGENSHSVYIPAGQGSFSIGSTTMAPDLYDVLVDHNKTINWIAFDKLNTPAGSHWPRFFYYWGNDLGFIKWSEKRPIEDFQWTPLTNVSVDLEKAQINRLTIQLQKSITVTNVGNINNLNLVGNLDVFQCKKENLNSVPQLGLYPDTSRIKKTPYTLPNFEAFEAVTSVDIKVTPLGQPFDCKSLLQFKNITHLALSGNLTNLKSLEQLKSLESLAIRYCPDISDFPEFNKWPSLVSFIGWNIEESSGKLLRTDLRKLSKQREMKYASVSKLRKPFWFTEAYGLPFSGWIKKNEKIAIKSYKTAVQTISSATSEKEVKTAIVVFIKSINALSGIETSEREDVGLGVEQLIITSPIKIKQEKALQWFDDTRDF
ncbi:leucine-rich repeat domain-containing protein [Aquimarina sp. I32.4]|uniref:leucine-rich repeat domain-containing protein n=1 Tax=Aquimarina sp. I32.4 TaxID=2053903 RepID=UPI000CDF16D6|nr:leucine-rich repeat domain-containing protein [Aquimarina sp. I32.4]